MKKSKKILIVVLAIILVVAIIVGGYFLTLKVQEKSALKTIDEMFTAIKTGNEEEIKKYVNYEDTDKDTNIAEDDKMSKSIFQNVTYEVVNSDTKLNNCEFKINVSNKNFKTIFSNYFKKALSLAFSNISDDDMDKQLDAYLIEQYNSPDTDVKTTELTFKMKKDNGKWIIDTDKEQFVNALLPGYQEVSESLKD